MRCSSCGTDNEPDRKFCKECGARLALICPSCSAPNAADAKFCGECGGVLGAGSTARPERADTGGSADRGEPATERRLVSVLFADLVGFTSLSERRDAEDVRELLSRYFDISRETVERHGGLVEKFIGDAVMAVWGTPTSHEDDAERAVRSGLQVVEAVAALGHELQLPLQARVGVLTGEAAATVGAVTEGIVTGDLVNTASRLQSAAEPGTVLVGESTYRAASRAVSFEEVGPLALKGKDQPVLAWRALRVVARRGGSGGLEVLEPPFVGRSEDLRLIKELLHAVDRDGRARLVSCTGMAGIGKSRLAWELQKYVDGLLEDVYWHQGRCPAYGDGVSFWALGEMVRMRAGLAETDDPASARAELGRAVATYLPDTEERRWIEPRLAHLLGLAEPPPGEREELFSAWRTFFERIAERGTVVMVFEDLQWADAGLLDFIESMLEWSRNHPILIVTLSRPELAEKRPSWGMGQRSFTALHLEPLAADAMRDLVRGYVLGMADDGVEAIVDRADGIPLYAVETVRMLLGRGVLEPMGDAYALVGEVGALEIPETLHAVIAARLDALPPDDRALLQDAAVLGKSFTLEALAAVSGEEREGLEPRLRGLMKKEFLGQEGDPRSPERGQYSFLQGLIREVAYGTLSKADRRRKHLATAHHYESLDDEELAGVVAAHYVDAHRATRPGPDAEALAVRARDWLSRAAERAMSLGSPEQAVAFAEQALKVNPSGEERAALLQLAGRAAARTGRSDSDERAVAYLFDAAELFRGAGDLAGAGMATAEAARPLSGLERRGEAIERMERALEELGQEGDERARAELCAEIGDRCSESGRDVEGVAWADRALELAERLDLLELVVRAIGAKSLSLLNLGRHREALILAQGAVSLAREAGNQQAEAGALVALGVMLTEDDNVASLEVNLQAVEAARRSGERQVEMVALANAAEAAIDAGRLSQAEAMLADIEGRDLPAWLVGPFESGRALLTALRGDLAQADEHARAAASSMEASSQLAIRTWLHRVRATIALMRGDLDGAYVESMRAISMDPAGMNTSSTAWAALHAALWSSDPARVREAVGAMRPLRGRWVDLARTTGEAGLAALEGRIEEASERYREALESWAARQMWLDYVLSVIDATTVLPPQLVPEGAIEEARARATELGLIPLLERLDATVGVHSATS